MYLPVIKIELQYQREGRNIRYRYTALSLLLILGACRAVPVRNDISALATREDTHRENYLKAITGYGLRLGDDDPGLRLYRDPATRDAIFDFYVGETGSPLITDAILRAADRHDIPLPLAFSLAWTESRYDPRAVNSNVTTIDRGLFQLNSASFPRLTTGEFFDPVLNADQGLGYLAWVMTLSGDVDTALSMYNAGPTRIRRRGPPRMTVAYVSKLNAHKAGLESRFRETEPGRTSLAVLSGKNAKNPARVVEYLYRIE